MKATEWHQKIGMGQFPVSYIQVSFFEVGVVEHREPLTPMFWVSVIEHRESLETDDVITL